MEKLQIKSEYMSLEKQIEILERAKHKPTISGLCNDIDRAITIRLNIPFSHLGTLKSYIPLFTRENAIKYANAKARGVFWWETDPFDSKSRLNFLNWMIEVIKKEIENEKTKN